MKAIVLPSPKKGKTRARSSSRKSSIGKKDKRAFSFAGLEKFARKVDFIYQNVKYPEAFAEDLLKNLRAVAGNGSIQPLLDCLVSWEATAELDATPQTRKRILKAYADFKNGRIDATNSRKRFLEIVNAE